MRILMMTNTYLPQVGGVARSVATITQALRQRGHRVVVVAPEYAQQDQNDPDVVRVPAIQNFNGSDFSVRLPIPGFLNTAIDALQPELIHAHHPFLLGDNALRTAAYRGLPLVFTHHTMYERYTHYVPGDSPAMKRYAIRLGTDYSQLCDQVIAPSESIAQLLRERGVTSPIEAIPTGIDAPTFEAGDRAAGRRALGLDANAFVVGHVGRLAPEKNLAFLARALARAAAQQSELRCLIVGEGPSKTPIQQLFEERGVADQLVEAGTLEGQALVNAYHAMDLFAFASHTETQGMVLAEAMTAGVPAIAVDAPGAREVIQDGHNGTLLDHDDENVFSQAVLDASAWSAQTRAAYGEAARASARAFSLESCVDRLEALYGRLGQLKKEPQDRGRGNELEPILRLIETEWNLWSRRANAAAKAVSSAEQTSDSVPSSS